MKISIKREQNQASLSFAERLRVGELCSGMRKKFRPQVKNKLLLLLALLMTAATGAWAQDAKHLIKATYREQTRLLEQPLPYATTVGELYEAVTGKSISDLISSMSLVDMTLTGITSNNTSVVSIGELNGASTPVTVNADGEATVGLNFGSYALGISVNVTSPLYANMKDGVKDADKWTVKVGEGQAQALPIGGLKGDGSETVTLQYTGRLKVKGVKATIDAGAPAAGKTVDLSTLTADYEAQNGDVLTGTLASNVKISIADGATVTLDGVTINGVNNANYEWAGITCEGDATIILSGTNTVKGFYEDYPGIQAAADKTLTINGTGSLTASSYGYGAGIGGGSGVACGNIEIQGGTITATSVTHAAGIGGGNNASCGNITISGGTVTATGGARGAGIGGGRRGLDNGSCGNILISGGTVTATGGENAAGIGGGRGYNDGIFSSCGTITITTGVTKVTATMGDGATNSIGAGFYGTCGTVTIGGTKYWENNAAVNGGDTYLAQSPLIYDPSAPAVKPAATVTTAPTGAAIVGRLNTTNTKPTSTDGFSEDVPTAQGITASGKVYVWYYVKGDPTHSDSEIAATAIEVPVADIVWDATNVSDLYVEETNESYEKEGVTLSGNGGDIFAWWTDSGDPTYDAINFEAYASGGYTFTAPNGKKFAKIEMTLTGKGGWDDAYENENLGDGWAFLYFEEDSNMIFKAIWKGSAAASTVGLLTGANSFSGERVTSIVFYLSE